MKYIDEKFNLDDVRMEKNHKRKIQDLDQYSLSEP